MHEWIRAESVLRARIVDELSGLDEILLTEKKPALIGRLSKTGSIKVRF